MGAGRWGHSGNRSLNASLPITPCLLNSKNNRPFFPALYNFHIFFFLFFTERLISFILSRLCLPRNLCSLLNKTIFQSDKNIVWPLCYF